MDEGGPHVTCSSKTAEEMANKTHRAFHAYTPTLFDYTFTNVLSDGTKPDSTKKYQSEKTVWPSSLDAVKEFAFDFSDSQGGSLATSDHASPSTYLAPFSQAYNQEYGSASGSGHDQGYGSASGIGHDQGYGSASGSGYEQGYGGEYNQGYYYNQPEFPGSSTSSTAFQGGSQLPVAAAAAQPAASSTGPFLVNVWPERHKHRNTLNFLNDSNQTVETDLRSWEKCNLREDDVDKVYWAYTGKKSGKVYYTFQEVPNLRR